MNLKAILALGRAKKLKGMKAKGKVNKLAKPVMKAKLKVITKPKEKNRIKRYISQKTGIHLKGFEIIIIDEIPRNNSGKILYSELDSQQGN